MVFVTVSISNTIKHCNETPSLKNIHHQFVKLNFSVIVETAMTWPPPSVLTVFQSVPNQHFLKSINGSL